MQVLGSPHVNKKAREQELSSFKRLLDIFCATNANKTVDDYEIRTSKWSRSRNKSINKMAGIIGKNRMTSIFDENGINMLKMVEAGPCVVTQLKTDEKDGYESVQIGFEIKSLKKSIKSEIGHLKKSNTSPKKVYKEFPSFAITESDDEGNATVKDIKVGDILTASQLFNEGDFIDVSGKSKGKGFQGVVKRHGRGVGDATVDNIIE